jgi:hypothetical protein
MISPLANNYESMPQHEREKSRLLGVGIRRVHIGSILREGPGFICFFFGGGGVMHNRGRAGVPNLRTGGVEIQLGWHPHICTWMVGQHEVSNNCPS